MNRFQRGKAYKVYAKLATEDAEVEFIAETHGPVGTQLLVDELRSKNCDGEILEVTGLGENKVAEFFANEPFAA